MYSPVTRLFTVLELLQSYKQMSGAELARRLEVDGRTVRRYIVMLQDMGIPVEAERGPYGAYQLQRGYKLPPLMFTDAEAVALTMGLLAIREYRFPVNLAAVEGALAKTERVMPEKLLRQVRGLRETIVLNVTPLPFSIQHQFVATLSAAAQERQQVFMRYRSFGGEETERAYDPYGIVFNDGYWYTVGYCHLRDDLRTFRLDRIAALEQRDESFERPNNFDTLAHVLASITSWPGSEQIEVLLQTSIERAREVFPAYMGMLEATEDGVIFRRTATQLDWIAHVLVAADFPVRVVQPEALREKLRQIAVRASQIAANS